VTQLLACKRLRIHKRSEAKPLTDRQGKPILKEGSTFADTQGRKRLPIHKEVSSTDSVPIHKEVSSTDWVLRLIRWPHASKIELKEAQRRP
jgi:hypothetical protein